MQTGFGFPIAVVHADIIDGGKTQDTQVAESLVERTVVPDAVDERRYVELIIHYHFAEDDRSFSDADHTVGVYLCKRTHAKGG